jgi:hypothetical protein
VADDAPPASRLTLEILDAGPFFPVALIPGYRARTAD